MLNDSVLDSLRSRIEQRFGMKMSTPRDFDHLSAIISKSGRQVSPSTLKRIWGYNRDISASYRPYRYTMVALASLLGYVDIEDFAAHHDAGDVQSVEYMGETVVATDIEPGSVVEIMWEPDRQCEIVAVGDGCFKVVSSLRGRLKQGDMVKFMSLTQNAPLYFSEVVRPASDEKFIYTAGLRSGIVFRIKDVDPASL